jgi:hypothetical protein
MPRIALLFASAVLLLLCLAPQAAAGEDPAADARRAEARASVLIDWSRDAKTARLNLGPGATAMLDLWLDYCRSRYDGRRKPSTHLSGIPQETWGVEGGALVFRPMLMDFEIDRAAITPGEVPALLDALSKDAYPKAAGVEGDDEVELWMWGLMLANEAIQRLADQPEARSHQAAWTRASQRLRDHVLATIDRTPPLSDGVDRSGTLAGARLVWLQAIQALGLDKAGAILTDLHAKFSESGSPADVAAVARMLAGCHGASAEAFVKVELASGDWARQRVVLEGLGEASCPDGLRKVAEFARTTDDDAHAHVALDALRRAGVPGTAQGDHVARLLRQLFLQISGRSPRKLLAAVTLVDVGHANARVVRFLEDWLERMTDGEGLAIEADRLRRLIDDAKAQAAAE